MWSFFTSEKRGNPPPPLINACRFRRGDNGSSNAIRQPQFGPWLPRLLVLSTMYSTRCGPCFGTTVEAVQCFTYQTEWNVRTCKKETKHYPVFGECERNNFFNLSPSYKQNPKNWFEPWVVRTNSRSYALQPAKRLVDSKETRCNFFVCAVCLVVCSGALHIMLCMVAHGPKLQELIPVHRKHGYTFFLCSKMQNKLFRILVVTNISSFLNLTRESLVRRKILL